MKNSIVLCGGGSAGHVMPNIALIPHLEKHFKQIHYIGGNGIEKQIVLNYPNIIYHEICMEKFRRNLSLKNLLLPYKLSKSIFQAKKNLKQIKPNCIFSKGGFASYPICFAGKILKIPIISHESDSTLGLANKLIYPICNTMFCTYKQTTSYGKKCEYSGNILREKVLSGNKTICKQKYFLDTNKKTLLIIGGSLGANAINKVCFECAKKLSERFNVFHVCGKGKTDKSISIKNYHQIEFEPNIEHIFALADFVVSRAGSNAIFEFLALKKPMLLIPLSKKASRGDQIKNAKNFENDGLCLVLHEDALTQTTLLQNLSKLEKFQFPKNLNIQLGNDIILKKLINL